MPGLHKVKVELNRFDPEREEPHYKQQVEVDLQAESTLLDILLAVQEKIDPSLAFDFGCRFKNCGLCGIMVNGEPRLACLTKVKGDEEKLSIAPLENFPVVRDLVIDRGPFWELFEKSEPYPSDGETPIDVIPEMNIFAEFSKCRECLLCMALCNQFGNGGANFGGPFIFVRLAQLYLDPRDKQDRVSQALSLGIDRCRDCGGCSCRFGVPIKKAIDILLEG
ncbi:MAG: 2Fe-2S iron-sulfur cluster-binding protein [Thermodesulfobacteriota bacterium]|nr:2Fe-2S iron-sulfur cluster-binding protein [Thermodesulfobacteriota bacterium]